jgi:hypothetical protein
MLKYSTEIQRLDGKIVKGPVISEEQRPAMGNGRVIEFEGEEMWIEILQLLDTAMDKDRDGHIMAKETKQSPSTK